MTNKVCPTDHDTKLCHEVIPVLSMGACIGPDLPRTQRLGNIKRERKCGFLGGLCKIKLPGLRVLVLPLSPLNQLG